MISGYSSKDARAPRDGQRWGALLAAVGLLLGAAGCTGDDGTADGPAVRDAAGPEAAPDTVWSDLADSRADANAIDPATFVGKWRFVEMVCEGGDVVTYQDYTFTLELETTRGTAIDATASCVLTTRDFPIVATQMGYELVYGSATQLTCNPSPCALTITTQLGSQTSETTYACPDDFPVQGPREVIIQVDGTTLKTGFFDMPCLSRYARLE